jgi:hypothetical protein
MKSTTYAGAVCKRKLVGGRDREQRMREIGAICHHVHRILICFVTPCAQEC